ncbi:2-octaprenyl-6-methoxyphenol hydroxylase [Loktanella ponticola]|uniref:2-octaprenyl-6-methoxyphenol hydroxylase n=1 Tax=Yoonia ponticola TaxID=1524255 RepID=A0A7W9F0K7_9RHOB|nr:UbiH/UbiF family hydroxylase [Yoonia ponticola]MBB5723325.1 2-octaprenyl-6-methoxyphenol hydroxylase [Yoonia ponticola]
MKRITTDIVISGGGVAGLTAAAAFGAAGFNVIIVDPALPVTNAAFEGADLRTTAFLQPAQAFLDAAGLWDRLAPFATPLQVMRIADVSGEHGKARVSADFDAADISDKPFGWNLPNWLLRREMLARLKELPNVEFMAGTGFVSLLPRETEALVMLTGGVQVRAKLVIGADGRNSAVRDAVNIGVKTNRYGQKAISFAVTHPSPHNNVSTEIHRSGGPFTFVPLPDHEGEPCSAVVWMESGAEVTRLMALSDEDFESEALVRSAGLYGSLTLATRRMVWPIISQIADAMSGPRTALVAEAAHVVPPIGAQGLNMSLSDLAVLLDLARENELGSRKMLDAYNKARHGNVKLRVSGIDALNRASMSDARMLQELRIAGIKALYEAKPVRRGLMKLGLGAG